MSRGTSDEKSELSTVCGTYLVTSKSLSEAMRLLSISPDGGDWCSREHPPHTFNSCQLECRASLWPVFSFFPMTLHGTTPDQSLRTQMHTDTYSHMHISADMQCHPDGGGNLCLPRECIPPPPTQPPFLPNVWQETDQHSSHSWHSFWWATLSKCK